ncbi:MAG: hypothetical protein HYU32_11775 [candidate division NC10 bacterium]|nr:hypothetical protein [candidate division NC10 bacterium]
MANRFNTGSRLTRAHPIPSAAGRFRRARAVRPASIAAARRAAPRTRGSVKVWGAGIVRMNEKENGHTSSRT